MIATASAFLAMARTAMRSTVRRSAPAFLAVVFATAGYFGADALAALATAPTNQPTVKVILEKGHGSGVHIGDGFILTAAHVTGDAKDVQLKTSDGKFRKADVLWVNKTYDIALLRTSPAMLGKASLDCRTAAVGETIVASGNPLAVEFVSSYGKIAGAPRSIGPWKSVLVTDITTVMGQSGGGVFAEDGRVVGITVGVMGAPMGIAASLVGFGFVVPSSDVCGLLGRVV